MLNNKMLLFDLQLFGDESVAGDNNSAVPPATAPGDLANTAADPEADEATANTQDNGNSEEQPTRLSFEELIKTDEYKKEANAFLKKKFGERYGKKIKPLEDRLNKSGIILGLMNERYGLDPNSDTFLDELRAKVEGDSVLYEEQALARGMDTENYMTVRNAEKIIENNRLAQEAREQEIEINDHIESLKNQSAVLKKQFPDFDIDMELSENSQFQTLVAPKKYGGVGLSVKDAFYALHHDEIEQSIGKAAVDKATATVAESINKNKSRPTVNGQSKKASADVKRNIRNMTLEDFRKDRENFRLYGISPNI